MRQKKKRQGATLSFQPKANKAMNNALTQAHYTPQKWEKSMGDGGKKDE